MTAKALKDVMQKAETWPQEVQEELADIAREMDESLRGGIYRASREELVGIDRGLKAAREGRFAKDDNVEAVFAQAPSEMKVTYTDEALHDLDVILAFIASNYPEISFAFERRLRAVTARIGVWPESARQVVEQPGVRVVPLIRYPYNTLQADDVAVSA